MNARDMKENVIRNSFWSLATNFLSKIGGLAFTIVLAHYLLPAGFGMYSLVFSVAVIFSTFADFGLSSALTKYLSYSMHHEKDKISVYHRHLLRIKIIITAISGLMMLILAYPIANFFFKVPELFFPLILAVAYSIILSMDSFYFQAFYSIEKVNYLAVREFILQALKILLSFGIFIFLARNNWMSGIFAVLSVSCLIALGYSIYSLKRLAPEIFEPSNLEIDRAAVNKFVSASVIVIISIILFSYVDSLLLGAFVPVEYVGYYKAAFGLVWGIVGLLTFASYIFLSVFSKSQLSEVKGILDKSIKYLNLLVIPCIFLLIFFGRYAIKLLYGDKYLPATQPYYFLVLLIFPAVFINLFSGLFAAKDKVKDFAKITFFSFIFCIVINFIFIKTFLKISPQQATVGVAIAMTLSWFFYFILSLFLIKKSLGFFAAFGSIFQPIIAGLISILAAYTMSSFIDDMTLWWGILEVISSLVVYCFVIVISGGINLKEIKLFYGAILTQKIDEPPREGISFS